MENKLTQCNPTETPTDMVIIEKPIDPSKIIYDKLAKEYDEWFNSDRPKFTPMIKQETKKDIDILNEESLTIENSHWQSLLRQARQENYELKKKNGTGQ